MRQMLRRITKFSKKYSLKQKYNKHGLLITLLVVLAFGLAFVPAYRYQINPDGVSYVTIAEKYSHFDFRHAINGYWGPLLSWLDAPFFWIKIPAIAGIKIIQVLASTAIAYLVYKILKLQKVAHGIALFGCLFAGLLALDWGLPGPITSDLLATLFITCLFYLIILARKQGTSRNIQILIGASGAMLYFSKSIGFFLFIGIWLSWLAADWLFQKKRSNLADQIKGKHLSMAVFLTFVLPFAAVLSLKYHKPTIGTSGSYNFSLVGPNTVGHPMLDHVFAPPNKTAASIWEDPTKIPVVHWSPFSSQTNLDFFWHLMHRNTADAFHQLMESIGVIMIIALLYVFSYKRNSENNYFLAVAGLISALVLLAYIPIFVFVRYLEPIMLLALVCYVCFTDNWFKQKLYAGTAVLLFFGILSGGWAIWHIHKNMYNGRDLYQNSMSLKNIINSSSNVLGDNFDSQYLCMYTHAHCFGTLPPTDPNARHWVVTNNINYMTLVPESADLLKQKGINLQLVPNADFGGRNIYKVIY